METENMIILGSTGSVGTQAAETARRLGVSVYALSGGKNVQLTESQAREFKPKAVAMSDESAARDLKTRLADANIKVYSGESGILEMISRSADLRKLTVVNSITGCAGLKPTLAVLDAGHRLALANKESLVVAGQIVTERAKLRNQTILPVDSEHCAIFQCLEAGRKSEVKRILLTASGGPFFGYGEERLKSVTLADALAHPTWKMGKKITVDSATLMNKGFEVIEAVHLFGVLPSQIKVVIQRESIIHSMVEYIDNSIIAQMSVPDMRHCVQHALTYPERTTGVINELDFAQIGRISFAEPDRAAFPLLALAEKTVAIGGAVPAVMNAADEIAVAAFLDGQIGFCNIPEVVINVTESLSSQAETEFGLDGIFEFDRISRIKTLEYIKSHKVV